MIEYLKYSGIWISFIVNPWHWHFHVSFWKDLGYNLIVTFGFISIRIAIDDGKH